jgi:hypothetical protein
LATVTEHGALDGQQAVQRAEAVEAEGQPGAPTRQPGDVEAGPTDQPDRQHRDRRHDRQGGRSHAGGRGRPVGAGETYRNTILLTCASK